MHTHATERGFTLIETLVAMILIATVGYSIFALINSHFVSLRRVQTKQTELALRSSVLEMARHINPMEQPIGRLPLGPYELRWNADKGHDLRTTPLGTSFLVGTFQTALELYEGARLVVAEDVLLVGYRRQ